MTQFHKPDKRELFKQRHSFQQTGVGLKGNFQHAPDENGFAKRTRNTIDGYNPLQPFNGDTTLT